MSLIIRRCENLKKSEVEERRTNKAAHQQNSLLLLRKHAVDLLGDEYANA